MTQATRTEEDLLGAREVPLEAYWGIHTLRATENYRLSGAVIGDEPSFVRGMVQVKKASALANRELGTLTPEVADAIVWACDQILRADRCLDQFPIDVFQGGAGTSVNMNTNEVVANLALEHLGYAKGRYDIVHPNDHVNKSQSTNDAYPTGFRLGLYAAVQQLEAELCELIDAFLSKSRQFADVLKMGRTQLQDAVPMSLGQEFQAFAVLLDEEVERLIHNSDLLLEVNLGATAIGTGLNTPPGYQDAAVRHLREVTGVNVKGAANLLEATSDTGAYVSMHAAIKRLAVKLSKICNDLRLLSSGPRAGLGEIRLPERAAGSSIMPAAEAGQLQLNVMEPVIGQTAFESIRLLRHAMKTLRELCVVGIEANEAVCRDNVLSSIGIVTYLNEVIGHHNGDLVGRECARSGRSVREVVLEMGLLDEDVLDELLSPENLLRPRYRDSSLYLGDSPASAGEAPRGDDE